MRKLAYYVDISFQLYCSISVYNICNNMRIQKKQIIMLSGINLPNKQTHLHTNKPTNKSSYNQTNEGDLNLTMTLTQYHAVQTLSRYV